MATQAEGKTPELNDATKLAVDRTRLAHERTLMAWVRTAVSMISFGFTIYKTFQTFMEKQQTSQAHHLLGPTRFAFLMILIGLIALLLATVQHRRDMQQLRAEYGKSPGSLAEVVSALVALLGIIGLLAVIFRQ